MDKQKIVFLVEDDFYITEIIRDKLISKGYQVIYAPDGEKAIRFVDDLKTIEPVDIILLDLLLPKVHGFEVLKKLKGNPATAAKPVIILSNLGSKKDIDEGMRLGAATYIIKANFTPDEIIETIEETLGHK